MLRSALLRFKKYKKRRRRSRAVRGESNKSIRQTCFDAFDQGERPVAVAKRLGLKERTALTYFQQWRKAGSRLAERYKLMKALKKAAPEMTLEVVVQLGKELGAPPEEVVKRWEKPWGIKKLMLGDWGYRTVEEIRTEAETRLYNAMEFLDLQERLGVSLLELHEALDEIRASHQEGGEG